MSIRFPIRRPCMSVKAVTTVSIAPASASSRSSSTESIPEARPGPPGRSALIAASIGRHLVLLEGADRTGVAVPRPRGPPDGHEYPDDEDEWRVVERSRVEVAVPRDAGVRERQIKSEHADDHKEDCADIHEPVLASERPGSGLEIAAGPQA